MHQLYGGLIVKKSFKELISSNKSIRVLIYSAVAIIVLVFLIDVLLSMGLNYEKNPLILLSGIFILFIPLFMGYKVRYSNWSTVIVYSFLW